MSLSDALDSPASAKAAAADQARDRDSERERIRAKLSKSDSEFLDEARRVFPGVRLVGIKFSDGEQVGSFR